MVAVCYHFPDPYRTPVGCGGFDLRSGPETPHATAALRRRPTDAAVVTGEIGAGRGVPGETYPIAALPVKRLSFSLPTSYLSSTVACPGVCPLTVRYEERPGTRR